MSVTGSMTRPMTRGMTASIHGGPWTPALLFETGQAGAWYDPSALTTLFQERTGASATTPATVGDPVGTMRDRSGNGNHATASADAARPVLQQSGGLYYLSFDGVDDLLVHGLSGAHVVFAGVQKTSAQTGFRGIFATSAMMMLSRMGTSANWGTFSSSTERPSGTLLGVGTPYVIGMPGLASGTFRTNGADDGAYAGTSGQGTAHIGGLASQSTAMRMYGLVARTTALSTAERTKLEAYLAEKAGVSL